MYNFCTYLDSNYLSKFILLYKSISDFSSKIYVLCLDDKTEYFLKEHHKDFIKIEIIRESQLREKFNELIAAKKNRSKIEYYFTLSPFLPRFIFSQFHLDHVCYVDSDLYFFDKPNFNLIDKKFDIQIVKQGHKEHLYGKYNVGYIMYSFSKITENILKIWSNQCIESCIDYPHNNKYADQKYLDDWYNIEKVKKLEFDTINLAPWNIKKGDITFNNNMLYNKNSQVICYHFHGVKIYRNKITTGLSLYKKKCSDDLKKLYIFYIKKILAVESKYNLTSKSIRNKYTKSLFKNIIIFFKEIKKFFYQKIFSDEIIFKDIN